MTDITVIRIEVQETEGSRFQMTSPDLPDWTAVTNTATPDLFRDRAFVDTLRAQVHKAGFRFVSARLATPAHRVLDLPEPSNYSRYIILSIDANNPPSEL